MLRLLFLIALFSIYTTASAKRLSNNSDSTNPPQISEGVLRTRVSFPNNPMNELLSLIDFSKGNIQDQLRRLQDAQQSETYAKKIEAQIGKMTAAEQQAMGQMMMAAMMSPLYATINFDQEKALAKAFALNYTLESFMNTQEGKGKMVAIANDNNNSAAITFSAKNLQEAWQKEQVDAKQYNIQWLNTVEVVSGLPCKKVVYTYKGGKDKAGQLVAYKLIAWYSSQISNRINFAHPFYLDIPNGVLKIEVLYDAAGKNRMLYEVTAIEQKRLRASDFVLTDIHPVEDWDANPVQASMNMLNVFMSQAKNDQ
ncbi:hypothetical protein [Flavisolibacter tropicus]|uniref:DUF4412 domain-containing protein n=1 Tax=Flavisolibacter tropicus TaxID=1492898 RepID=A0A172U0U5_9BACT|nr:hypothetical protein [Flavisolibacter tropicus]ANE52940.1 hypothetical protein SY85_23145 [Flavisolibacter tropicus]